MSQNAEFSAYFFFGCCGVFLIFFRSYSQTTYFTNQFEVSSARKTLLCYFSLWRMNFQNTSNFKVVWEHERKKRKKKKKRDIQKKYTENSSFCDIIQKKSHMNTFNFESNSKLKSQIICTKECFCLNIIYINLSSCFT